MGYKRKKSDLEQNEEKVRSCFRMPPLFALGCKFPVIIFLLWASGAGTGDHAPAFGAVSRACNPLWASERQNVKDVLEDMPSAQHFCSQSGGQVFMGFPSRTAVAQTRKAIRCIRHRRYHENSKE